MQTDEPRDPRSTADADLILRTRSGDGSAFGELWHRHYPSGMAVARSITSSIDPDDLVQESFTRIYQAVLKGGGPNGSFRAYLFTSIRNTAAAWGRARRETAMDELDTVPDPDSTEQAASEALDRGLTAQAFRSLPTRWQEVLWYTEIEQIKPGAIAPLLGMKAGAVSQLSFRAREGLREAWVQAHLRSTGPDSECHWTIEHLGAHSRGNLSTRDRKRVDAHLDDCARCLIVAGEAQDVSNRLALVLLPLVLGVSGAAGYAALLQRGGTMAVAVAAMPSSVVSGGAVSGGAVAGEGLVGLPVGVDGASATGGAGGAGGTSGGAITGIGALVGAGSAALVVAGVVAAATIVPGLVNASPVTSLPNAGAADDSSISSDVSPDNGIDSTEKPLLKVSDDAPEKKDDRAPDTTPPAAPPVADGVPEAPAEAPAGEGGDHSAPPATNPGSGEDEGQEEEEEDNGDENGGGGEEPTPPIDVGNTDLCLNESLETVVSVELDGEADAKVRPLINDSTDGTTSAKLDGEGHGTAILKPTGHQIWHNADVTFEYVDLGADLTAETSLWKLGVTWREMAKAPACETDPESPEAAPAPPELPDKEPALPEDSPEEATVVESTVVETPATEAPAVEAPPVEEPVVEEPVAEEPAPDESPAEEPASEEPAVDATSESARPTEQAVGARAEDAAATEDTAPAE